MTDAQGDALDPVTILDQLPPADPANPAPFLAGTFALYRGPDGSVTGVFDIAPESQVGSPGVQRVRIPPGILRAASTMLGGRGPLGKLRAMVGRRGD